MSAIDFVLYCTGTGVLFLSGAGAVRLLRTGSQAKPKLPASREPVEPSNNDAGLADRLRQFQEQRFASPLVQRQVDLRYGGYAPSPGEPGSRRVVPFKMRSARPKAEARPSVTQKQPPPLPKQETGKVVALPIKPAKPEDPSKKE